MYFKVNAFKGLFTLTVICTIYVYVYIYVFFGKVAADFACELKSLWAQKNIIIKRNSIVFIECYQNIRFLR